MSGDLGYRDVSGETDSPELHPKQALVRLLNPLGHTEAITVHD